MIPTLLDGQSTYIVQTSTLMWGGLSALGGGLTFSSWMVNIGPQCLFLSMIIGALSCGVADIVLHICWMVGDWGCICKDTLMLKWGKGFMCIEGKGLDDLL